MTTIVLLLTEDLPHLGVLGALDFCARSNYKLIAVTYDPGAAFAMWTVHEVDHIVAVPGVPLPIEYVHAPDDGERRPRRIRWSGAQAGERTHRLR